MLALLRRRRSSHACRHYGQSHTFQRRRKVQNTTLGPGFGAVLPFLYDNAESEAAKQCLVAVGKSALKGFVDPVSFVAGYGKSVYEAQNRIGPEDYGKPEYRGTFKRDVGSALRIGLRRFIPGYVQASLIVGGVKAVTTFVTDPSCEKAFQQ